MQNQVDISKHPYGLGGGTIISGSTGTNVFVGGEGFWYYPVTATTAIVVFNNIISGSGGYSISASFTAGNGVYGPITQVTQSAGISILYSGSANDPRYTFNGR
jgi:hypothetical protein